MFRPVFCSPMTPISRGSSCLGGWSCLIYFVGSTGLVHLWPLTNRHHFQNSLGSRIKVWTSFRGTVRLGFIFSTYKGVDSLWSGRGLISANHYIEQSQQLKNTIHVLSTSTELYIRCRTSKLYWVTQNLISGACTVLQFQLQHLNLNPLLGHSIYAHSFSGFLPAFSISYATGLIPPIVGSMGGACWR